jgi:maltose alpha-D-glucosyltransferase/alpha-amylase
MVDTPRISARSLLELAKAGAPPEAHERIGAYLESAWLLGQRTAELHLALASDSKDPSFAPEAFITFSQRSLYQSMRKLASQVFQTLRKRINTLPEAVRPDARRIVELESEILHCFQSVSRKKVHATRIRIHGDYHLGQVLFTGKDFVIIDFEGEPARSLSERRLKRSPLRDVAGMLRSFHYAADAALVDHGATGLVRPADATALEPWARFWHLWTSVTFLKAYLESAGEAHFIPQAREELIMLLDAFLLDKAIYELGYELNNRPDWVTIPVRGLLELIDEAERMA